MENEKHLFDKRIRAVFDALLLTDLLTPERIEAFYGLFYLLREDNEKYNLTAVTDMEGVILLHFADSLMGASLIPEGATVLDVGCGAGFPSLPLALCRPDIKLTATDATAKKIAFVDMAAARMGLSNVKAVAGRAEVLGRGEWRDSFDVVTARAVAALPMLCELCAPFCRVGGHLLALKGRSAAEELLASRHAIGELKCKVSFTKEYKIGEGDTVQGRGIILLEKTAKTPDAYPRPYARIKSRPL